MRRPTSSRGAPVPSGRLSRLARFGGLAAGVGGSLIAGGARQLASGKRPRLGDLLLTPANALRVTEQLANLRGAAMKMGQLMSMDAGELLPPEMSDILARLRSDARHMPEGQLRLVLDRQWGAGWQDRFDRFDWRPIAAASIGQVHRAVTRDGRDLAIKVQYPGVRASIDSDVDNVATLIRLSTLVPKSLDMAPMLAEAKRQLHEEADYVREAACLRRFRALLADRPEFVVPEVHADLTTESVLAMTFVDGVPIETLTVASEAERNRAMALLIELTLREFFEFGVMQTDPNFANYRYDMAGRRIVLLDFGATRDVPAELPGRYLDLARAGLARDREAIWRIAVEIGLVGADTPAHHRRTILDMAEWAVEPLRIGGPFDFGDTAMVGEMRDTGLSLAADRDLWHIPPPENLFLQRKFGGMYLLAARLKARVDVAALLAPWLDAPQAARSVSA